METHFVWVVMLAATVFSGGLFIILPRIGRRGLLFGVYVGEEASQGDEARRITAFWYRAMTATLVVSVGAGLVLWWWRPWPPEGAPAPIVILMAGYLVFYLSAYLRARRIAAVSPPAAAAASLTAESPADLRLPIAALVVGVAAGLGSLAYTAIHYAEMPERIPTHFGFSGVPDAWSQRSFLTILLTPVMTLVIGAMLGSVACLTARAKRALRYPDGGSLAAQLRFRRGVSQFLAGTTVLSSALLTLISWSSVRVAIGQAERLTPAVLPVTLALLAYGLVGSLYLALRYGQGGARLERGAARAPLTNGLADNRQWVLGSFYVNRDDPSYFVERRFGFGYTVNLGNWKAVAVVVGFIGLVLVLTGVAALSSRP